MRLFSHCPSIVSIFCAAVIAALISDVLVHAMIASVEEIYNARNLGDERRLFDIISSGSIMQCVDTGSQMHCNKKLHVTGSIQNAESDGSGVLLFSLTHLAEGTAQGLALSSDPFETYTVSDEISIIVTQSPIRVLYPLTYMQDFNDKPYETVFNTDASGRSFSMVNRCSDSPTAEKPGCGWVWRSGANGVPEKIPFSQGFCCNCELMEAISGSYVPRSGMQCNVFAGRDTAHCLSNSPLWYSAYEIGSPAIDFEIRLLIIRCRPKSLPSNIKCGLGIAGCICEEFDTALEGKGLGLPPLGPQNPSYCFSFPGSNNPNSCDIQFELIGTFAPYEGYTDFSSKRLLVPVHCSMSLEDAAPLGINHPCFQKVLASSDRWLMVDTTAISTDGSQCNKIGTSYEAFATQGRACEQLKDTCLAMQIKDLYDSDVNRLNQGKPLKYFLQSYKEQTATHPIRGLPYLNGGLEKVQELIANRKRAGFSLAFPTQRFQKSMVSLTIRADEDSFRYSLQVSDGAIVFLHIPIFEAGQEGRLQIIVENTGHIASKYTIVIACGEGILPLQARQVNLLPQGAPGYQMPTPQEWKVYTSNSAAEMYQCTASLLNALGQTADSYNFSISTSDQNTVGPGGDDNEDRGRDGTFPAGDDANSAYSVCGEKCASFLDLGCALRSGSACASRVAGIVGGGLGLFAFLGIVALLVLKYPFVFTTAYRALCNRGNPPPPQKSPSKRRRKSSSSASSTGDTTGSDSDCSKHSARSDRSVNQRKAVKNPLRKKIILDNTNCKDSEKDYSYFAYLRAIEQLSTMRSISKGNASRSRSNGRSHHERRDTGGDSPWKTNPFQVIYSGSKSNTPDKLQRHEV